MAAGEGGRGGILARAFDTSRSELSRSASSACIGVSESRAERGCRKRVRRSAENLARRAPPPSGFVRIGTLIVTVAGATLAFAADFTGPAVCAECHARQFHSQTATHHAH